MGTPNVTKSSDIIFQIRDDGDTEWQIGGGGKSLTWTGDAPVEDTTSSSTPGDFSESEFTGYKNITVSFSGMADKRTGVDPNTGLNFAGPGRLTEIFLKATPCAKIRIINVETSGTISGNFNITSLAKTADRPGLYGFDLTLQAKDTIAIVGDI